MSLKSWKAEFYPVPADEVDAKDAIAHSLRKWRGLRKKNLERHGLVRDGGEWTELDGYGRNMDLEGGGCALCELYFRHGCEGCPLCPKDYCLDDNSPYYRSGAGENVEPIIKALERALRRQQRRERKEASDA